MYETLFPPTAAPPRLTPEAAARSMLSHHWDGLLPVDPMEIARRQGLRLHAISPFDEGYTGTYSGRFDAAQRLIEYSSMEAPVRQRFTVAHELGHYALNHGDAFRDDANSFSSRNRDPKERQANQFAAELLMPESAIRKVISSGTIEDADELAAIFNVSKVAMAYRVTNLGLLL